MGAVKKHVPADGHTTPSAKDVIRRWVPLCNWGRRRGISFRAFVMLLALSLAVILTFTFLMIPRGKSLIVKGLEAQARSLSASIQEVSGNAFVTGDYSFIVDHNLQVMKGSRDIRYIIVVKQDGMSMIHTTDNWTQMDQPDPRWNQTGTVGRGGIITYSAIARAEVYHYSFPLRFSGIDWGMLHIGLSLDSYRTEVRAMYRDILLLGLFCFVVAIFVSFLLTRQLTAPILLLRDTADRIVQGDTAARAEIATGDEVEDLAHSFNRMTDTMVETQRDITEARDYIQNILTSINEALIVCNIDTTITMVNKATLDLLGYAEEEMLGESLRRFIGKVDHDPPVDQSFEEFLQRGYLINVEKTFIGRTGVRIPILFSCSMMRGADGNPQGIVSVASDITQRKQVEEMLEQSRQGAIAASQAKSQFLANMSHEIRTPMNGVLGMLDLLLHSRLTPEQKRFAGTAFNSANLLLNLIDDILDLSRIEAGKLSLETIDLNLNDLIAEVVDVLSVNAARKGLAFTAEVDEEIGSNLCGDPVRIRQILLNLVGNAVKFTEQGSVTVRAGLTAQRADGVVVRFEVNDTGIGLSPEAQSRIFDPFTQADATTTRKHGGSGLGLSISKRLVSLMGGEMGVESTMGEGSTFWFSLPLTPSSGAENSAKASPCGAARSETKAVTLTGNARASACITDDEFTDYRILLAEDNAINQQVVIAMLSDYRCVVETAKDGKEAVELFCRNSYDMVLMDCQMPEMDGYEAVRMIRGWEQERGTTASPIVALTAHAMEGDKERCLAAGMDDYLQKPFYRETLIGMLRKHAKRDGKQRTQNITPAEGGPVAANDSKAGQGPREIDREGTGHVDWSVLNQLRGLQKEGAPDIVGELVEMFVTQTSFMIETLRKAVETKNAEEIFQLAHKLKSSSAHMGAAKLAALLKDLEMTGRESSVHAFSEVFFQVSREYDAVKTELQSGCRQT